jgi:hypothetical protein
VLHWLTVDPSDNEGHVVSQQSRAGENLSTAATYLSLPPTQESTPQSKNEPKISSIERWNTIEAESGVPRGQSAGSLTNLSVASTTKEEETA